MKNFSIRLDENDRKEIERIAGLNNRKPSYVFRLAVRHYLKAQKRKKGAK